MAVINTLEYDDIRASIVTYLKTDPYFKDFNFEASNLSRLINIMAYSTMYNGYYMKMLLDESMPDSARTKTSLIGHANTRNYLSKFISAAKSSIKISVSALGIDADAVPYIQIPRGQNFKGVDKNAKTIYFMLPYDVTLNYDADSESYEADDFMIIQGQSRTISYPVVELNRKYQITDERCDDTTVTVKVKTNKAAITSSEYVRKQDFYEVGQSDLCYYITASTTGIYQIHFGRDTFGREPKVNEFIEISYVRTDGADANDTNRFDVVLSKTPQTLNKDINFYPASAITCTTIEQSSGGLDAETPEELRYSILNSSRQRGRAVTDDDIKAIIISEFRDVESVNVWSGGTSSRRRYGKTYISIKPKTSELLTYSSKKIIENILVDRFGIISKTDLVFIDPNFTDILLTIKFKINRSITSDNGSVVKARLETFTTDYNKNQLSKFDINYYDSNFTTYLRTKDPVLSNVFTEKLLQKTLILNYSTGKNVINFGNTLKSVKSSVFDYGEIKSYFKNMDSAINLYNDKDEFIVKIGTVDLVSGLVTINIPTYVKAESIAIIATPLYSDVNTIEDNIVRIKTITTEEIL